MGLLNSLFGSGGTAGSTARGIVDANEAAATSRFNQLENMRSGFGSTFRDDLAQSKLNATLPSLDFAQKQAMERQQAALARRGMLSSGLAAKTLQQLQAQQAMARVKAVDGAQNYAARVRQQALAGITGAQQGYLTAYNPNNEMALANSYNAMRTPAQSYLGSLLGTGLNTLGMNEAARAQGAPGLGFDLFGRSRGGRKGVASTSGETEDMGGY